MKTNHILRMKMLLSITVVLCLLVTPLSGCTPYKAQNSTEQNTETADFSSWVKDAKSLNALQKYVKDVTDENSEHFIPEEDRIAAFDMDGTLYGELAPIYIEWLLYVYRVNKDKSFKPDKKEKALANQIIEAEKTGEIPENIERDHAILNAKAFAGMTLDEYTDYVRDFLKKDVDGFKNMTYKEAFYKPMIEVVNYLNTNGFTVYICSGTDRFLCRELSNGILPIADNHVIGMDVMLKATRQGDADGLEYVYTPEDRVMRTDELLLKSVKMNKVSLLSRELGKAPVLCFGNSSGDESMGVYTTSNNKYYSQTFMLIADDDVREYGDPIKAKEKEETWRKHNWEVISMKNDWKTIYGEDVTKE